MNSSGFIVAIVSAVLGSAFATEIVRQASEWLRRKRHPLTAVGALRLSMAINGELRKLVSELKAHSALLIESENGLRLSKPGQVMLVTITNEITTRPEHASQRGFVETPVDAGYNEILLQLITAGVSIQRLDTSPSLLLKDMYAAIGATHAVMLRVPSRPSVIRYVSIRFDRNDRAIDASVLAKVRESVSVIAGMIGDGQAE